FFNALGHLRAHFAVMRLAHFVANRVADFLAVLFANLLRDLAALHVAVLFVARLADRVTNVLLADLRAAAAHAVFHVLAAVLDARLVDDALLFPPAMLRHRTGTLDDLVAILGHVAIAIHRLAFFLEASLANLFVNRFADGLVAGMP